MTREDARKYINGLINTELPKAKKRVSGYDTYICPICGNGSGADGTGICTKDGRHYTCFKGCFSSLDYLDILKRQHGTESETEIFSIYGLDIDGADASNMSGTARRSSGHNEQTEKKKTQATDYTKYFKECHARANQTEYFAFRGIGTETVDRFMLGYDPAWRHPNAPTAPPSERVIIPTSKGSYLARAINSDTPAQFQKQKAGSSNIFNIMALRCTEPYVFVVEGEIDALSVIDVGGQAIGLGSTSNSGKFIETIKAAPPTATLILSLDNDDAGYKAQAEIRNELENLKIPFLEINISRTYNDPNEALQNDREGLAELVKDPQKAQRIEQEARKAAYIEKYTVNLNMFMGQLADTANTPAIPTGFPAFDDALDEGLYEGLYIIGAISSIGKTSLCLQIADQIAASGTDVIIFSLEMSRYELISKSLSRLTIVADKSKNDKGFFHARTNRQITTRSKYKYYSEREKELIKQALQTYDGYRHNVYIHEGIGDIGAEQIKEIVKEHISVMGRKPVIFIDYLQILAPYEMRATDKQNTDKAVLELKRMSREYKIPILAVSSFNRDNYLSPVNMASFKESGAIEYSSDVLLGLQFEGMDDVFLDDDGSAGKKTAKKAEILKKIEGWKNPPNGGPRKVQLKILKNRNGASGANIFFDYYAPFNYFLERTVASANGMVSQTSAKAIRR